ncbi:MAG TPA: hypothetical protein VNO34_05190 [Actinomycetota bacterium]|nr:hypothetical protein [Actinomycetota bacterium]
MAVDADARTMATETAPAPSAVVLPRARELVLGHALRTLDAVHLAVALEESHPWRAGRTWFS